MIDTTDPTPGVNPSDEGPLGRPAWAEHTHLGFDSVAELATVTHTWTAPGPAMVAAHSDLPEACHVQITQEAAGGPFIFLAWLDDRFTSTEQARAFAAILPACCDRLDGVA